MKDRRDDGPGAARPETEGFGLEAAMAAARRIAQFNRLSRHLAGMDSMTAARKGVGPGELLAIRNLRLSEIAPRRLDELCRALVPEDAPPRSR
jgi:hypothetical protein